MNIPRVDAFGKTRTTLTTRRGAVGLLSALGLGGWFAADNASTAKKKGKGKGKKKCRKCETCPQRGCCVCSATQSTPQSCTYFPPDVDLNAACADLCPEGFGTSAPIPGSANVCTNVNACAMVKCPVV